MKFYYEYILRSESDSRHHYTGFTENLVQRLEEHNAGKCPHTKAYRPWVIASAVAFHDKERALAFERYLKTHSGRAFATKHL